MKEYVVFSVETEVKDKKAYTRVKGETNARESIINESIFRLLTAIDNNAHDELLSAMERFFTEGVSKSMRGEG